MTTPKSPRAKDMGNDHMHNSPPSLLNTFSKNADMERRNEYLSSRNERMNDFKSPFGSQIMGEPRLKLELHALPRYSDCSDMENDADLKKSDQKRSALKSKSKKGKGK